MSSNHLSFTLPEGWVQATDQNSGQPYYANPTTGETSWQPPAPRPPPAVTLPVAATAPSRRTAVADAQHMVHAMTASKSDGENETQADRDIHTELQSLSAGQVADLVHLQQGDQSGSSTMTAGPAAATEYTPIDPHQFHPSSERTPQEQGRLVTRLHALREKVKKINN